MTLNEHLASVVMNYELRRDRKHSSNPASYYHGHKFICLDYLWNPSENIEQAMMCLDTFDEYWTHKRDGKYFFITIAEEGCRARHYGRNESLPMAICLAVGKATGYSHE